MGSKGCSVDTAAQVHHGAHVLQQRAHGGLVFQARGRQLLAGRAGEQQARESDRIGEAGTGGMGLSAGLGCRTTMVRRAG